MSIIINSKRVVKLFGYTIETEQYNNGYRDKRRITNHKGAYTLHYSGDLDLGSPFDRYDVQIYEYHRTKTCPCCERPARWFYHDTQSKLQACVVCTRSIGLDHLDKIYYEFIK